jgi:hypothetical protein
MSNPIKNIQNHIQKLEKQGRNASAAFERRKEEKFQQYWNTARKNGVHGAHVNFKHCIVVPTPEEQQAIDAENKIIQDKKEEQEAIEHEKQRIDFIKRQQRLQEHKIHAEAQRRIKEIAEQTKFEAAVQQKMKQLLSSDSTLNERMKVREAELQDLFI